MAKKPRMKRLGRLGVRTATKVQERDLIAKAKALRKHPEYILPKCVEPLGERVFGAIESRIRRIQSLQGDEKRLRKFTKGGPQLCRAYAAALLLAEAGKAPILAAAHFPWGETTYARKDKVKKEELVGVQHYDDPVWRLLAVQRLAMKKKLYVYSVGKGMVCTGRAPEPPKEFVKQALSLLKYQLSGSGRVRTCAHIPGDKEPEESYLRIEWGAADREIRVCRKCAGKKTNSIGLITQRIAGPDPTASFTIEVVPKYTCKGDCQGCPSQGDARLSKELLNEYVSGQIPDAELVKKHLEAVREKLEESSATVYIQDDVCYGKDALAFIDALSPTKAEALALKTILANESGPVIVEDATPSKVMGLYWDTWGLEALEAVTADEAIAKDLYENSDMGKLTPSQVVAEAAAQAQERGLMDTLPVYASLPPLTGYADSVARVFKARGKSEAIRALERGQGKATKSKSLGFALLLAMDAGKGKEWQYSKTEKEFAEYLTQFCQQLLNAEGAEYHGALSTLIQATGCGEEVPGPE